MPYALSRLCCQQSVCKSRCDNSAHTSLPFSPPLLPLYLRWPQALSPSPWPLRCPLPSWIRSSPSLWWRTASSDSWCWRSCTTSSIVMTTAPSYAASGTKDTCKCAPADCSCCSTCSADFYLWEKWGIWLSPAFSLDLDWFQISFLFKTVVFLILHCRIIPNVAALKIKREKISKQDVAFMKKV